MLEAGISFFRITTKHHDGFCLWDTQFTDFKVTRSPFKRDIVAELALALSERGSGLHFYYSLLDWTYPAYRDDWEAYVAYYQDQIRELCTDYGDVARFVFDGYWPRQGFDEEEETVYFPARGPWDLAGTYRLMHDLQPDAVIANNSHIPPLPGEDYQLWELDLPGENRLAVRGEGHRAHGPRVSDHHLPLAVTEPPEVIPLESAQIGLARRWPVIAPLTGDLMEKTFAGLAVITERGVS